MSLKEWIWCNASMSFMLGSLMLRMIRLVSRVVSIALLPLLVCAMLKFCCVSRALMSIWFLIESLMMRVCGMGSVVVIGRGIEIWELWSYWLD